MEQPELYVGDLRTFVGSLDGRWPVAEELTPAVAQNEQHRRRPILRKCGLSAYFVIS